MITACPRPRRTIRTVLLAFLALAIMLAGAPTSDAQFDPNPFDDKPAEIDWRNAFGRPGLDVDFDYVGGDDVGFWGTVTVTNTGDRALTFFEIEYVGGVGAYTHSCDIGPYFVYDLGRRAHQLAPGDAVTCTMAAEHVSGGFNHVRANVSAWTDLGLDVSATDSVIYYNGPWTWWSFTPRFAF